MRVFLFNYGQDYSRWMLFGEHNSVIGDRGIIEVHDGLISIGMNFVFGTVTTGNMNGEFMSFVKDISGAPHIHGEFVDFAFLNFGFFIKACVKTRHDN